MNCSTSPCLQSCNSWALLKIPAINEIAYTPLPIILPYVFAIVIGRTLGSQHPLYHGTVSMYLSTWWYKEPVFQGDAFAMNIIILTILISVTWFSSRKLHLPRPKYTSSLSAAETFAHEPKLGKLGADVTADSLPVELPLFKPLLFPCDISHRRFYPKQHDFKYSRLFVGVPVLHEPLNDNSLLSSYPASRSPTQGTPHRDRDSTKFALLSVDAEAFLQRGPAFRDLSLREKLDLYLISQNINDPRKSFPYAYLVTAPNFLGQGLNQVCFWYLYDRNEVLGAVIFEVNSTFDERRMYFARSKQISQESDPNASSEPPRFASVFEKDMHVSPFLERHGKYSTKVTDVLRTGRVDITIVMIPDSKDDSNSDSIDSSKPMLVSRLFSAPGSLGVDPKSLSTAQKLSVFLRHYWSSFMTLPRVLIQARRLWAKGLRVYYRPEPLNTTIPRVETKEEWIIEQSFRELLTRLARQAKVHMQYAPAAGLDRGQTIPIGLEKQSDQNGLDNMPLLQLRITTPAFYSELTKVHNAKGGLRHVFDRLCFAVEEKDRMAECSSAAQLRAVLSDNVSSELISSTPKEKHPCCEARLYAKNKPSSVTVILWTIMDLFRSHLQEGLAATLYSYSQSSASDLNQHIRTVCTKQEYTEYSQAAFTILIADKIAFGDAWILGCELSMLRAIMVIITTVTLVGLTGKLDCGITLLPSFFDWTCGF